MASKFTKNGTDLDALFELASDYPGYGGSTSGIGGFFTGSASTDNLGSRYLRRFGDKIPDVGYISYSAAIPAYTETINEGGEIIEIRWPYQPATTTDISNYFSPKGTINGFIRVPYVTKPHTPSTYDKLVTGTATGNGNLSASAFFQFEVNSMLFDKSLTVTDISAISSSFGGSGGGSVHIPLTKIGGITHAGGGAVVYRQRYQVGLSTTTSYTNGYGSSTSLLNITLRAKASNGVYSDSPTSNHAPENQLLVLQVILRHSVSRSAGGGGGGPPID